MTTGAVLVLLFLLGLGGLAVATLVVAVRGGRGPADPPASRPHADPAGFPVHPAPRGALHGRGPLTRPQPRRGARLAAARSAAASHTARDRRTARATSLPSGARPSPSTGRSSTLLP
ncbi:hypothetical protein SAMN04488107_4323 [Geodermatophilus saharensis]|uniref:Uncharacterized protein n=1 Tax=Geodermatophilus saharensis TaxID=1137994 RepID=A0A239IGI9_9ACTN|nr:hypothetical protein SAMN04488107_4323 [Geodermatophilus saharensis]